MIGIFYDPFLLLLKKIPNVLIFVGSLESANSSILAARRLFKDLVGEKNQDFMIIRYPIS